MRNFVINYLFEKIALNLYRSHDLCTTDLQMMDPNVKEHRRKGAANCHRKMAGKETARSHKEQRPPFNQLKHSRSRDTIDSKEKKKKKKKGKKNP